MDSQAVDGIQPPEDIGNIRLEDAKFAYPTRQGHKHEYILSPSFAESLSNDLSIRVSLCADLTRRC